MTVQLLIGILGGIVIWFSTNAIKFLLQRDRLAKALVVDLHHRISNLDDVEEYLDEYYKNVKEDVILEGFAHYTQDRFPFFEDVRGDLYKYFGTQNLIVIMRCYEALEEIEILMDGLHQDLYTYCEKQRALSAEDVIFFNRKRDRIKHIVVILKRREIRSVAGIPKDYRGMMSPAAIIKK